MKLRPDVRQFSDRNESAGVCRKCGCTIILLPEDKRNGFCFDCFDPYEGVGMHF
ncbi:MAG: hypothetical protein KAW09_09930 [Thermoplasmata archaeon]|nr:hypothetical protein [Thermoplasmata archaeon]